MFVDFAPNNREYVEYASFESVGFSMTLHRLGRARELGRRRGHTALRRGDCSVGNAVR
jgi:hypothetical protein